MEILDKLFRQGLISVLFKQTPEGSERTSDIGL